MLLNVTELLNYTKTTRLFEQSQELEIQCNLHHPMSKQKTHYIQVNKTCN